MAVFTKQKILVIHSQQWANQYAGGATGEGDSEQYWMRKLAEELVSLIRAHGHEVLLGPLGRSYADNVAWVNKQPGANFLLSLHSNATATTGDRPVGIGVYHAPTSTKGAALAKSLAPYLAPASATGKSYTSTLGVSELVNTYPPALLIENEFHDWEGSPTTGGSNWLRDPGNRTKLCNAYVNWIVAMYGSNIPIAPPVVEPEPIPEPTPPTEPTPEPTPPPETTPPPEPTPAPKEVKFRFGMAAQVDPRFGGSTNYRARGVALKNLMGCSIYVLTETNSKMRAEILLVLGPQYRFSVHSAGSLAILYDSSKWKAGTPRDVDFGSNYHGARCLPVTNIASGLGMDVVGVHIRPGAIATSTQKQSDLRKALTLIKGWPVLFAGDFAMNADAICLGAGLIRTSPKADTYDPAGNQYIDAFYVQRDGLITARASKIVDPGAISDHKWPLGQLSRWSSPKVSSL